jgi:hypothetical protein
MGAGRRASDSTRRRTSPMPFGTVGCPGQKDLWQREDSAGSVENAHSPLPPCIESTGGSERAGIPETMRSKAIAASCRRRSRKPVRPSTERRGAVPDSKGAPTRTAAVAVASSVPSCASSLLSTSPIVLHWRNRRMGRIEKNSTGVELLRTGSSSARAQMFNSHIFGESHAVLVSRLRH